MVSAAFKEEVATIDKTIDDLTKSMRMASSGFQGCQGEAKGRGLGALRITSGIFQKAQKTIVNI